MNIRPHIKDASLDELKDMEDEIREERRRREKSSKAEPFRKVITFTDGASRGNPGHSGIGVLVLDDQGQELKRFHKYLGLGTNNEAEYQALLHALDLVSDMGAEAVDCYMDSELLVRQLNGQYKVKSEKLASYYMEVQKKLKRFKSWKFTHVPREHPNLRIADSLANKGIDHGR